MSRVIVVSRRHDQLARLIMEKSYDAVAATNFEVEFQAGDILCWLPLPNEAVDDEVQELAHQIDQAIFPPTKIVMLSIAGSADDATTQQLQRWYGRHAMQDVLAHQYAVKMIDELEIPYTIIRSLPISSVVQTKLRVLDEGQQLSGEQVGEQQLVEIILRVLANPEFNNHSIGIEPVMK